MGAFVVNGVRTEPNTWAHSSVVCETKVVGDRLRHRPNELPVVREDE